MDAGMTLIIKYGGRGCAKDCSAGFTREQLLAFVTAKWNGLSKEEVYLSYDLLGAGELELADEDDMKTMFRLMTESGSRRINIYVRKMGSGVSGDGGSLGGGNSVFEIGESSQVSNVVPANANSDGGLQEFRLRSEEWRLLISGPGQRFVGGAIEFRKALIKYAIQVGFEFQYLRNGPRRVTAVCRFKDLRSCQWRINAVQDVTDMSMVISFYERNHTCGTAFGTVSRSRLNHTIVSDLIIEDTRAMPGLNPVQVQAMMKRNYGIDVSYNIAWKAMDRGRSIVYGDHTSSFGLLPGYFDELLRANPGSHVHLDVGPDYKFRRCFLAFKACLMGFVHCRPLVMVDGTFLKGRHRGCLLSAVAKDGDEGLYPIAFAVVNEESDDNWDYFFRHLRAAIGESRRIVFVSDRNHGILQAVRTVFPSCIQAYCYNHLKSNLEYRCRSLGKRARSLILRFFQKCAYASSVQEYEENVQKLLRVGGRQAEAFLNDTPKHMWSCAFFEGMRYGQMTSNASESWNAQIKEELLLPIVSMLDGIRVKLMQQISNRRQIAAGWMTKLCKNIEGEINRKVNEARGWDVRKASDAIWEVFSMPPAVVNIDDRSCTCKQWQINGVPCSHAVAVVYLKLNDGWDYVDGFFHVEAYRATYSSVIYPFCVPPFNGPGMVVYAPEYHQTRGRPKRRRIPPQGEHVKRPFRCGRCGEIESHNRRTCRMARN